MTKYCLRGCVMSMAACVAAALTGCDQQANLGPVANIQSAEAIRKVLTAGSAGGEQSAEAVSTGTGWATLRGQFVYDGTPPQRAPYAVSKEHNICAPAARRLCKKSSWSTKPRSAFKTWRSTCARPRASTTRRKPKTESVVFDQKECVFLTHVMPVSVGQPIQIKNSDPTGHNTKIEGRANTFNQTIPAGGAIPFTPQREETAPAPITCSIHPWMSAYLLPRKNGYVAVTDAEGRFEIANLPAGEPIEFQVWHESGGAPGPDWSAQRPTPPM